MLRTGDAAAAIIRLEDGRYVMQLRDARPDIWYPGYWGCFGGTVDAGETPDQAIARELVEELQVLPDQLRRIVQFDFRLDELGFRSCVRIYYLAQFSDANYRKIVLGEGAAIDAFSYDRLMNDLRVTPYDAFAIRLLRLSEAGE